MKDLKGKYTPKPWTTEVVQEQGRFYHAVMILGKNEYGEEVVIARTPTVAVNEEANAALIAACPSMYETLKEALLVLEAMNEAKAGPMAMPTPLMQRIEDVINKAEGRE